MGLFDRLVGAFKPPTMEHATFGHVTYMAMKDSSRSYWEGHGTFSPTGSRIQVFLDGDESGPSVDALNAWNAIQERYNSLWPIFEGILLRAYEEWIPDAGPTTGKGRFTLEFIGVPRVIEATSEWDLGYGCADDADHSFTILMSGWIPNPEARIDG